MVVVAGVEYNISVCGGKREEVQTVRRSGTSNSSIVVGIRLTACARRLWQAGTQRERKHEVMIMIMMTAFGATNVPAVKNKYN